MHFTKSAGDNCPRNARSDRPSSLGASALAKKVAVPSEVLERLAAKQANKLSYFQDDLVQAAAALQKGTPVDVESLKVLEEISDAADATASASFRHLRKR